MLQLKKIREDLKEIRYYYEHKELFNTAIGDAGFHDVLTKVKRYNLAVQSAPPQLYGLYVYLYVKNYTQEAYANKFGYEPEHICRLNKKLLLFLQTKITE